MIMYDIDVHTGGKIVLIDRCGVLWDDLNEALLVVA